jgi:cyclopropane fatty-acyl-phospholipid synthase-like methyltransferase
LRVLERFLPAAPGARVLEVASGSGEHAVYFAAKLPHLVWQPTDPDPAALASIQAWIDAEGSTNVRPPLRLDATSDAWPIDRADAVVCINMIHIAPWAACLGLLRGAARVLPQRGTLLMYGPYRRAGLHTAPSNARFDDSLRAQDPAWGVRNLDDVVVEARKAGLEHVETVEMPANNLSVVYVKPPEDPARGESR